MNEWLTSKRTRPICLRENERTRSRREIERQCISKEKRKYNDRGQSIDGSQFNCRSSYCESNQMNAKGNRCCYRTGYVDMNIEYV